MKETFFEFYGYVIFFYSLGMMVSYVGLMWLSGWKLFKNLGKEIPSYERKILSTSPYTPGISIIAPAYNEEKTIVDSVHSLLKQDYPTFEVVIVNDGSADKTLERMIEAFSLVEVPFAYTEHIHTKPFRRLFKSTEETYKRLIVVDKENGGTKADPVNAGLNAASYPYFVNTDVDCILSSDALYQCIRPVLEDPSVIAVSGMMSISNGCEIVQGEIKKVRPPHSPAPLFQTLEYMRSFLIGKMGWSSINAMPNVSGGYGLFDRNIVMAAGGYKADSFAEDMDMIIRMVGYCCDSGRKYRIVQIPATCCYTEGPPTLRVLYRQRVRWGRGLLQTFDRYHNMIFNPKYKRLGVLTLPYLMIYELLAPVIELCGMGAFIYLALTGGVNWASALIIFLAIFTFCLMLSLIVLFFDVLTGASYRKYTDYMWLMGAAVLEPFIYHPLIVLFSIKGYANYIANTTARWGQMTRQGFGKAKEQPQAATVQKEIEEK